MINAKINIHVENVDKNKIVKNLKFIFHEFDVIRKISLNDEIIEVIADVKNTKDLKFLSKEIKEILDNCGITNQVNIA